jgi:hypothetical protein
LFQLRTDEERKEASEIILAAIEMKSSIEPQWIGKRFLSILRNGLALALQSGGLWSVYMNRDFQCWMQQPHSTPHKK